MGIPHSASEEFVYNGYHIPKGALAMANVRQPLHDSKTYKDSHVFRPERFLGKHPKPDPHNITFGFGRRICSGKELAGHMLHLIIAMSLAISDISWPLSDSERPIVQRAMYNPGLITKASNYSARFTPRSAKAEELTNSVAFDYPFEAGDPSALAGLHWSSQLLPFPSW